MYTRYKVTKPADAVQRAFDRLVATKGAKAAAERLERAAEAVEAKLDDRAVARQALARARQVIGDEDLLLKVLNGLPLSLKSHAEIQAERSPVDQIAATLPAALFRKGTKR